jgi:hypothetical protein
LLSLQPLIDATNSLAAIAADVKELNKNPASADQVA